MVGLDNLDQAQPLLIHPRAHAARARAATPKVVTGGPQACSTAAGTASSAGAYTADQLASAYGLSGLYGAGDQGAGQTVALFELEPNRTSDIAAYQSCYATSASVNYVKVDSGAGNGSGSGEAALDIEDVIGLAPQANILVYQGPNRNANTLLDTYNAIISQDRANVISTSWGACEAQLQEEQSGRAASENTLFEEAATQGQTMFAAAGDDGSEDCSGSDTDLAVDDPASQPYVTGVGGTHSRPWDRPRPRRSGTAAVTPRVEAAGASPRCGRCRTTSPAPRRRCT